LEWPLRVTDPRSGGQELRLAEPQSGRLGERMQELIASVCDRVGCDLFWAHIEIFWFASICNATDCEMVLNDSGWYQLAVLSAWPRQSWLAFARDLPAI